MKYTISIVFCLLYSVASFSQNGINPLNAEVATTNGNNTMLTNRGLNDFVAKKVAYFLSGEADLSLYSFSLKSDIADGTFSFNYNNTFRRTSTGRVWNVYSVGLTTDALQGLGVIIKNSKFQANIGANFKVTFLIPATVSSGLAQRQRMSQYRNQILNETSQKYISQTLNPVDPAVDVVLAEKLINEFYEAEADKAIDGKRETYDWISASWISVYGYVPFTNTKNNYINNYTDTSTSELATYNFKVSMEGNFMIESTRWGQFLATVGISIFNSNEAISELADEISLTEFQAVDTTYNGFMRYTKLTEDEPYSKTLKNYTVGQFYARFVYFFPFRQRILGLSANYNTVIGGKHQSTFTFGLPISAPADKAGDKRLNIEPQLIINDLFNIKDNKTTKEKLWFGIKIGVPFGSTIY